MGGEERGKGLYSPEVYEIIQRQVEKPTRSDKIKTELVLSGIAVLVASCTCALSEAAERSVGLPETLVGAGLLAGTGAAGFLGLVRRLKEIDERRGS